MGRAAGEGVRLRALRMVNQMGKPCVQLIRAAPQSVLSLCHVAVTLPPHRRELG